MWAELTTILAKLPRKPVNGLHGALAVGTDGDWISLGTDLERYRTYADDWDGQGARGIPGEVIDSAVALAAELKSRDVIAPTWVLPGFEGTVGFEWEMADSVSISIEITGHGTAEYERYVPGQPLERSSIGEPLSV